MLIVPTEFIKHLSEFIITCLITISQAWFIWDKNRDEPDTFIETSRKKNSTGKGQETLKGY
uniref:Uncharacterized protein n=1 Tax=Arion vulgaris TaxID=1028688 RepID=A0A0B7A5Q5_9EUPU